jgi:hypothetical protein
MKRVDRSLLSLGSRGIRINLHFLIEFSREIWSEFAPTYGKSLNVCYSSIGSFSIQILYEMAEVLPLHKMRLETVSVQIDGQKSEIQT